MQFSTLIHTAAWPVISLCTHVATVPLAKRDREFCHKVSAPQGMQQQYTDKIWSALDQGGPDLALLNRKRIFKLDFRACRFILKTTSAFGNITAIDGVSERKLKKMHNID